MGIFSGYYRNRASILTEADDDDEYKMPGDDPEDNPDTNDNDDGSEDDYNMPVDVADSDDGEVQSTADSQTDDEADPAPENDPEAEEDTYSMTDNGDDSGQDAEDDSTNTNDTTAEDDSTDTNDTYSMDNTNNTGDDNIGAEEADPATDSSGDSGSTADDPDDPIKRLNDEKFSNLSDEQSFIKTQELKNNFLSLYNTTKDIIKRVANIPRTDDNIKIIEFVNNKLIELKELVYYYMANTFDTKTYIENAIQYQECLAILNGVNRLFIALDTKDDTEK